MQGESLDKAVAQVLACADRPNPARKEQGDGLPVIPLRDLAERPEEQGLGGFRQIVEEHATLIESFATQLLHSLDA